jgi:hypothetical protein
MKMPVINVQMGFENHDEIQECAAQIAAVGDLLTRAGARYQLKRQATRGGLCGAWRKGLGNGWTARNECLLLPKADAQRQCLEGLLTAEAV